jgi:hypothetical protein
MSKVLKFPVNSKGKKSLIQKIQTLITEYKNRKEKSFQDKIEYLKNECYEDYLKQILKKQKEAGVVDFPEWMYRKRLVINVEAVNLAISAVQYAYKKYGRRHIEKCYNRRIAQNRS